MVRGNVPENENGVKYTPEMLEQTGVAELKSVENGGLVEYKTTRRSGETMQNGGAVILYLNAVNSIQPVEGYDPDNFKFS